MESLLKCLHNSHEFNFWVTRCKYTDIRLDVTERSFTSSEVREKRGRKQCSFLLNAVGDISYSWGGIKSSLFHSVKISLILIPYREWDDSRHGDLVPGSMAFPAEEAAPLWPPTGHVAKLCQQTSPFTQDQLIGYSGAPDELAGN